MDRDPRGVLGHRIKMFLLAWKTFLPRVLIHPGTPDPPLLKVDPVYSRSVLNSNWILLSPITCQFSCLFICGPFFSERFTFYQIVLLTSFQEAFRLEKQGERLLKKKGRKRPKKKQKKTFSGLKPKQKRNHPEKMNWFFSRHLKISSAGEEMAFRTEQVKRLIL